MPYHLLMRYLIIITVLLYACSSAPDNSIDYTDPEVMKAYDELVLGITNHEDRYELRKDTITISSDELMYLYTIVHNGTEVYQEVHRESLCPKWMVAGKEVYRREDVIGVTSATL